MVHSGLEGATLDFKPNTLPTELGRLICRVGFKFFLYSATYSYNVNYTLLCHACIIMLFKNMYERVLVVVSI